MGGRFPSVSALPETAGSARIPVSEQSLRSNARRYRENDRKHPVESKSPPLRNEVTSPAQNRPSKLAPAGEVRLFLFGVPAVLQCHFPGGRDKASCLHQSAQPFLLLCAGVSGHECRQCSGEFPLHRPAGRGLAAGRAQPHFLDKERPGHLEQSGVRAF